VISEKRVFNVNFVENSSFEEEQNGIPKNWYVWSPRSALLPKVRVDDEVSHSGQRSLKMCGEGKPHCFVKLGQIVRRIVPGKYYQFKVYFRTVKVQSIHESILVELSWLAKDSTKIRMDWADRLRTENGWKVFETVVQALILKGPTIAISQCNLSAKPLGATFSERHLGHITVVKLLLYFSTHSSNIFEPISLLLKKPVERNNTHLAVFPPKFMGRRFLIPKKRGRKLGFPLLIE